MFLYQLFISHFNGYIEGLFIAKQEDVAALIGKSLFFANEDLNVTINMSHIVRLDVSSTTIDDLLKYYENGSISGYNPIHMISSQIEED